MIRRKDIAIAKSAASDELKEDNAKWITESAIRDEHRRRARKLQQ